MQASKFHNGGYVGHKIELAGYIGHFSAWYGPDGSLLDAEQRTRGAGRAFVLSRSVKRDGPAWKALEAQSGRVASVAA